MRLIDLDPKWLNDNVFIFRSPAGHGDWLLCKRVPMTFREQHDLVYNDHPDLKGQAVVMTVPTMAWSFSGNDFETLTVSPSIDASASGNWHGFIRNGAIV